MENPRKIRPIIGWIILTPAGLLASLTFAAAATPPTTLADSERPVAFLGNQALPPLIYRQHGAPAGLVIDLARALATRLPRPAEIEIMDWAEAQQRVLAGQADALLQINTSPERLQKLDFPDPLLLSEFTIYVAQARSGIAGMTD